MARPGSATAPRGHVPQSADTLSLARTISERRLFCRLAISGIYSGERRSTRSARYWARLARYRCGFLPALGRWPLPASAVPAVIAGLSVHPIRCSGKSGRFSRVLFGWRRPRKRGGHFAGRTLRRLECGAARRLPSPRGLLVLRCPFAHTTGSP